MIREIPAGWGVRGVLSAVILFSVGTTVSGAQTSSANEFAAGQRAKLRTVRTSDGQTAASVPRWYASGEYLFWRVKGAPLSVPLVTTGPDVPDQDGWITRSDTTILYGAPAGAAAGGNDRQEFPWTSGARLKFGYWLDDAQLTAVEVAGFMLQQRSAGYAIASDANGFPVINVPVNNTITYSPNPNIVTGPGENGYPPSLPGLIAGGISINNTLRLWGAEAAGVLTLQRSAGWHASALIGVRYLDLYERFDLSVSSAGLPGTFFANQSGSLSDLFETQNRFAGLMAGLRGGGSWGPFSVDVTGRLAIGGTYKQLTVAGFYTANNFRGLATSSGPYGIFAQPANSGTSSSTDFAIVPEAQVKLGYDLNSTLRLSIGYDFLYISDVIRPGDQLNRNLPKGQIFQQGGTATSAVSPTSLFRTTDFYAHGVNIGLTAKF